nr:hypothetical protein [Tanacetum cinerariifolium]
MQEELLQFKMQKMDVKSVFLYETIVEEVYVCQPPGFEDLDYPDKVYKVVKALYGLHQAPRACQDKYVAKILRMFGLTDGKSASTPTDTEKPLLKDSDGEDVDVHTYRSMIGSLMYLTSSRPDIMFAFCACARFQITPKASNLHAVKRIFRYLKGKPHSGLWYPKDSPFNLMGYSDSDYAVVATSSTEAEFVASASCCAQVLWIQNQLMDYGLVRNVDSSSKFYMYPRFLQLMIDGQVSDLSSYTTKYTSPVLTQKVFANMRRVGWGYSGVDTPLFEGMFVPQQVNDDVADDVVDVVADADAEPTPLTPVTIPPHPQELIPDKVAQALEITKLKQRVRRLENKRKLKVFRLKRLRKVRTAQRVESFIDIEVAVKVENDAKVAKMDAEVHGRLEESQAQVYHIDLEHAKKVLSMQDDEAELAKLKEVIEVVTTANLMTEVVTAVATTITAAPITTDPSAAKRRKRCSD